MLGTFGGALEARRIDASNGTLIGEVTGEVEAEEGVLVVRRIHVAMQLLAQEESREIVDRVHGIYAMRCLLIARSTTQSSFRPLTHWSLACLIWNACIRIARIAELIVKQWT
jgi:hypothetical protein